MSNITLQYVGESLSEGSKDHFRGIIKTGCNELTLIPYAANNVIRHDMTDNSHESVNITGITTSANGAASKKFVGGAVSSCSGMIYGGPHSQTSALTVDSTMSCFACSVGRVTPSSNNPSGADQSRGPVADTIGTKIYTPAYSGNGNERWNVIDAATNTELPAIPWATIPRTAQVYTDRPNWDQSGTHLWMYSSIYGGVDAGNGKIYGAPFGSPHLNILNKAFGTSYWGSDEITGNAPGHPSSSSVPSSPAHNYTYLSKYIGGALADNGHVYAHGHKARSILKINVNTDAVTEIPYPDHIIDQMVGLSPEQTEINFGQFYRPYRAEGYYHDSPITQHAASVGSVKAANGKIYNIPRGIPYIIWIDPTDDSIGYQNISGALNFGTGATASWYGAGVAVGNDIYYAPERANKILKISV